MNPYEITYIVRPDLEEEQTRAAVEGVTGRLESAGAEIVAVIPWNPPRRRMAYPIKDFGDGFYVTTVFRLEPQALKPIENALKLNERILRYLLIQATDQNIKQAQQRLAQQQAGAAAPRPQPETEGVAAPAGFPPDVPIPAVEDDAAAAESATPTPGLAPEGVTEEPQTVDGPAAETAGETAPKAETVSETMPAATSVEETEPAAEPVAMALEVPAEQPEE